MGGKKQHYYFQRQQLENREKMSVFFAAAELNQGILSTNKQPSCIITAGGGAIAKFLHF